MRQIGPLFGVSAAAVHRVVARVGPYLGLAPVEHSGEVAERLWIVDGTLVPTRDRRIAASSKNYRFSANVQVVIDAHTRLVVAVGKPVAGNRADRQAWRESGVADTCAQVAVMGDGAYFGTGVIVAHRKRPGRDLLPIQEADNAEHRRIRARVEHVFARMKHPKILRDCRLKGDRLYHAAQAVATLHNLAYVA